MPTKRLVRRCSGTAPASERDSLPVELLLEIVARSDVTTIVRCARTTKFLRRAILEPAFRRRFALQYGAHGGGFDPGFLVGVSFLYTSSLKMLHINSLVPANRVVHTPSPIHQGVLLYTSSLEKPYTHVAARDGLLLLGYGGLVPYRPDVPRLHLDVYNTFTGRITSLPPAAVPYAYPPVFLSVGDDYELLFADREMRFQTFSSNHRRWGVVRQASTPRLPKNPRPSSSHPAVVIGRTVYWLCPLYTLEDFSGEILALDVEAEAATTMDLPPGCLSGITVAFPKGRHLLLASVLGRLSLLVSERCGISMWVLAPTTATWSRQLVIGREEIEKQAGLVSSHHLALDGFGERSGAVIVRVDRSMLLRLDLGTKAVSRLHDLGCASVTNLFLHEINLVSFLRGMKSFST